MSNQKLDHTPDQWSLLHILLRVQPGRVPGWFLSRSMCGGFDVLTTCGAAGIFLIVSLIQAQAGASLAALSVIPSFALFLLVYIPFPSKEYRARRKMRQQQETGDREPPER